jgi:hypothetical protein
VRYSIQIVFWGQYFNYIRLTCWIFDIYNSQLIIMLKFSSFFFADLPKILDCYRISFILQTKKQTHTLTRYYAMRMSPFKLPLSWKTDTTIISSQAWEKTWAAASINIQLFLHGSHKYPPQHWAFINFNPLLWDAYTLIHLGQTLCNFHCPLSS